MAHDYFTQRGGAERVALELARQLDTDRIVTAFHRHDRTFPEAADFDIDVLKSAIIRPFGSDPRAALPFLAHAWSTEPALDAETVVVSSSGWAHGIRVTEDTRKIVYCHNPARWLYQGADYTQDMSAPVRGALSVLAPALRRWDRRAARTADLYLANSTSVAARVRAIYDVDVEVVHPPVSIDIHGPAAPVTGLDGGFFLTVARPRGYKGTELLKEAFAQYPQAQLVVVGADMKEPVSSNVVSLGRVSEQQLRWLYANAQALISVSHEDFGLTPLEANAFGTPSLVLRRGGFLDSTAEGVSGQFIDNETIPEILRALRAFPGRWDRQRIVDHAAAFSPAAFGARMRAVVGMPEKPATVAPPSPLRWSTAAHPSTATRRATGALVA